MSELVAQARPGTDPDTDAPMPPLAAGPPGRAGAAGPARRERRAGTGASGPAAPFRSSEPPGTAIGGSSSGSFRQRRGPSIPAATGQAEPASPYAAISTAAPTITRRERTARPGKGRGPA
jgi:hypothetical protein